MPEQSLLVELGVGGIFAILVIRIVLDFLGKQKRNGKSGELDPAYWEAKFRQIHREEEAEHWREVKSMLGKVLERLPPR